MSPKAPLWVVILLLGLYAAVVIHIFLIPHP